MPPRGCAALISRRRHSSDLAFSTTSPSSSESGRKRAIGLFLPTLVRKLRRPHRRLKVWSTRDFSPTLVPARRMNSEAWTIGGYRVCPPMNSRIMEVGGTAAISEGFRADTFLRNSSSEEALG